MQVAFPIFIESDAPWSAFLGDGGVPVTLDDPEPVFDVLEGVDNIIFKLDADGRLVLNKRTTRALLQEQADQEQFDAPLVEAELESESEDEVVLCEKVRKKRQMQKELETQQAIQLVVEEDPFEHGDSEHGGSQHSSPESEDEVVLCEKVRKQRQMRKELREQLAIKPIVEKDPFAHGGSERSGSKHSNPEHDDSDWVSDLPKGMFGDLVEQFQPSSMGRATTAAVPQSSRLATSSSMRLAQGSRRVPVRLHGVYCPFRPWDRVILKCR